MNKPKKYREKVREVEAIQYTGDNLNEVKQFCAKIKTKEGKAVLEEPDRDWDLLKNCWVAKFQGEFLLFTDKFAALYEEVKENA